MTDGTWNGDGYTQDPIRALLFFVFLFPSMSHTHTQPPLGQCEYLAIVHCMITWESGVEPKGNRNWCHTMAPELGTTKLVDAQQNHMGQCFVTVTVHCTVKGKSGVTLMWNWCHTMAPELGTTKLMDIQQNITTMGQSVWAMNVHCTFTDK